MDAKLIVIIAVVAVVAAGGATAAVVISNNNNSGGNDTIDDASQVAAAFSKNYTGFFGTDFYLADGATKMAAKVYYPNGSTSGYGADNNYIYFKVYENASDAKTDFDTNKKDYEPKIGTTVMGSQVKGTFVKASLDDAIGYYNNFNMGTSSVYIYYTGYKDNLFFESYISLKNTSIQDESEITKLSEAICNAIKNPVSTDQAKKYVAPTPTPTPTPTYTGVALRCYNYTDNAKLYGNYETEYSVTSASTAMDATLETSDSKYYITIKVLTGGSAATQYNTDATEIEGKIGQSVMGDTYHAITEKTGADGGTGYYYNGTSGPGVKMYDYVCYKGNYYAHVHLRSNDTITAESAASLALSVIAAIS
jgi:hypothetical protein